MKKKQDNTREKARRILQIALAKKPEDPLTLDLRASGLIWDYFIMITANSSPHAKAIVSELVKKSKEENISIHHIEDDENGDWVLIDYFDVLLHLFSRERREFYRIERLFKKARKVNFRFKKDP